MAPGMNAPLYTTEILRLAASLAEPRELDRIDGQAKLRSPTCGSVVAASVQLDEKGAVRAFSQRVQACAFGQASAALLERAAMGHTAAEVEQAVAELGGWLNGTRDHPGGWAGLDALRPARSRASRHGAILLPFRALLAAMQSAAK